MIKSIHSKDNKTLVNWLKLQRCDQNLSMRELAAKLDVHHSVIGKIEQCERRLDIIEYMDYCKALKVDPQEGLRLLKPKADKT